MLVLKTWSLLLKHELTDIVLNYLSVCACVCNVPPCTPDACPHIYQPSVQIKLTKGDRNTLSGEGLWVLFQMTWKSFAEPWIEIDTQLFYSFQGTLICRVKCPPINLFLQSHSRAPAPHVQKGTDGEEMLIEFDKILGLD